MLLINSFRKLAPMFFFLFIFQFITPYFTRHFAVYAAAPAFEVKAIRYPQTKDTSETFTIPVTLGAKSYELHPDTGGPLVFVLSDLLPEGIYNPQKLYPARSKERCPGPSIDYRDNTVVDGDDVKDTVQLGQVPLHQFVFLAAKEVTPPDPFALHTGFAGSFGMNMDLDNWVVVAYRHKVINSAYTVEFMSEGESKITFSVDPASISTTSDWWPRDMPQADEQWAIKPAQGGPVYVVDTGNSVMDLPLADVQKYFDDAKLKPSEKRISGDHSYWYLLCSLKMPDFTLKLADRVFTIPGGDLMGPPVKGQEEWCSALLVGYDNSPDPKNPTKETRFYLGLPFIKNSLVHFDMAGDGRVLALPRSSS